MEASVRKNAGNEAKILVVVLVLMLVLVLVVMLPLPVVMGLMIFGFRKKVRGSDDWSMLLPLNPQGFFRGAPRKLMPLKKRVVTAAIAKETGLLWLSSVADVLPFAISPMIILRY